MFEEGGFILHMLLKFNIYKVSHFHKKMSQVTFSQEKHLELLGYKVKFYEKNLKSTLNVSIVSLNNRKSQVVIIMKFHRGS